MPLWSLLDVYTRCLLIRSWTLVFALYLDMVVVCISDMRQHESLVNMMKRPENVTMQGSHWSDIPIIMSAGLHMKLHIKRWIVLLLWWCRDVRIRAWSKGYWNHVLGVNKWFVILLSLLRFMESQSIQKAWIKLCLSMHGQGYAKLNDANPALFGSTWWSWHRPPITCVWSSWQNVPIQFRGNSKLQ